MTETNTVYAGLIGLTIVPPKSKNYGCDFLRNFDSITLVESLAVNCSSLHKYLYNF